MEKRYRLLVIVSCFLALIVVSLGAYTRLSNAGLGCPDWPGCYGFLTVPNENHEMQIVERNFPGVQVDTSKAWIEMIHRYFASFLGMMILIIFFIALKERLSSTDRAKKLPLKHTSLLLVLVLLQGMLGMWTVTMNLQPLIVMGHLLGGFSILGLLALLAFRLSSSDKTGSQIIGLSAFNAAIAALVILTIQIALGGWVAANYAAPHCTGLPICNNIELFSLSSVFHLPLGQSNYEYGVLPFETRLSIHFIHRIWALVTAIAIFSLAWKLLKEYQSSQIRQSVLLVVVVLISQLTLGGLIVYLQFPLSLTLFHNIMAALLLLSMIRLCYLLVPKQGALS